MPVMTGAELKKQIKEQDFHSLYFLYGDEEYMKKYYTDQMAKAVASGPMATFNLQRFEGNASLETLRDAVEALPVMSAQKCVVVRDLNIEAMAAGEVEDLKQMIADIPPSTVLVFWQDTVAVNTRGSSKWRAFLKHFEKTGNTVQISAYGKSELARLLVARARQNGKVLSPDLAMYMIELAGGSLQNLLNEMDKLCAYTTGDAIEKAKMDAVIIKSTDFTVFDLARCLVKKQGNEAHAILADLLAQKEEPVAILAVLGMAYTDMYRVKVLMEHGLRAQDAADIFQYKGKEFRLRNAGYDQRGITLTQLRKSMQLLFDADWRLKSSRADNRLILEETLAKLMTLDSIQ